MDIECTTGTTDLVENNVLFENEDMKCTVGNLMKNLDIESMEGDMSAEEYLEIDNSDDDPDFQPSEISGNESSGDEMSDIEVEPLEIPGSSTESHLNQKENSEENNSRKDGRQIYMNIDTIEIQESPVENIVAPENSEKCHDLNKDNEEKCIGVDSLENGKSPAESKLKPEEQLFDINYPGIFTKKYVKGANNQSKHKRTYDRRHACYYCGKLMTNIQTHVEHAHKTCKEVEKMLNLKMKISEIKEKEGQEKKADLKPLQKELHRLQDLVRNKGDHNHNSKVFENRKGEIILSRRRESNDFDVSKYGPCLSCFEWIILDHVQKHKTVCSVQTDTNYSVENEIEDFTKKSVIIQAKILKGQITVKPSKRLLKEVYPYMWRDEIANIAQNDKLIVALGEIWLMKNIGNKLRRKHFTSFRMRLAARMLCLLRESTGKNDASFSEFLKPEHFDDTVECSYKACQETEEAELKHPSTAIKIGYDISRLASAKLGFCIKNKNENGKLEATDFLRLMNMEWSLKVNRYARTLLDERHFNKSKSLPIPGDIVELASFLVEKIKTTDLSTPNPELFREVVILTETRLLMYNKRRPGELESLSVNAYLKRPSLDETELSLRQNLSHFEKHLLESQDLVEIRGKENNFISLAHDV